MKHIDCRGLSCPGPVIQVKKALEEAPGGLPFSIDVDSVASRDNVLRFAQSRGADVQVTEGTGGSVRLVITTPADLAARPDEERQAAASGNRPPAVFITGETLGDGDPKLGRILMEGFVNTLTDQEVVPDRIILMNAGVKLAAEGSPVLEALRTLADRGCEIQVCGTCLEFFSLSGKLAVGTVSNMFDIQGVLLGSGPVIKI